MVSVAERIALQCFPPRPDVRQRCEAFSEEKWFRYRSALPHARSKRSKKEKKLMRKAQERLQERKEEGKRGTEVEKETKTTRRGRGREKEEKNTFSFVCFEKKKQRLLFFLSFYLLTTTAAILFSNVSDLLLRFTYIGAGEGDRNVIFPTELLRECDPLVERFRVVSLFADAMRIFRRFSSGAAAEEEEGGGAS